MLETKCGFDPIPGGAPDSGGDQLAVYGPTIFAQIGFDPSFVPGTTKGSPVLPSTIFHALIDTGAGESCIDSLLATQLNLPIIDRRSVSGVHGSQEVNMHLAQVHFPKLGFTLFGAFAGVHLAAGGQPHLALIGRTFLRHFRMVYDGLTGDVTLTAP